MIPIVKIVVNTIRNEIARGGQGMSMGVARIRAISISMFGMLCLTVLILLL